MCVEGFTTKTWLRWLWGWQVRSVALRIGVRRGRVHFQGGISSFSGKLYALWVRPFNWLDQAHPGNWGSSPLFKINWLRTLTTSTKHLQSSILVSVWVFEDCSLAKMAHQTDQHSWWYHPFLWLLLSGKFWTVLNLCISLSTYLSLLQTHLPSFLLDGSMGLSCRFLRFLVNLPCKAAITRTTDWVA